MKITTPFLAATAAILLGMAAPAGAAQEFSINFDGPGTTAGNFVPSFLTISYGKYVPLLDEFDDPIANTEHWEIDTDAGTVGVLDPSTVGWGAAPSLAKALDGRDGTLLLTFDTPVTIDNFLVTLDNSTFGNLFNSPIEFYNETYGLLKSVSVDQTVPGLMVSSGAVTGAVKTIVLPAGAFYDNIQAVPEPGATAVVVALTAAAAGFVRRRSRRRTV